MPSYHSNINRLNAEIAKLRKDEADQMKKESSLSKKANDATIAASRSKNLSTISSKLKEAERANNELSKIAKKKADIAKNISTKVKQLNDYTIKQSNEDSKSQKRLADTQKKLLAERISYETRLNDMLKEYSPQTSNVFSKKFDFFISHASEDKEDFVRLLACKLNELGANIFYDEYTLSYGDSLRKSIEHGLSNCRFGIVILSSNFFAKKWPELELNGLSTQEINGKTKIIPIWHKVSYDEVASFSPILADKLALNTSVDSTEEIAKKLYSLLV